MLKDLTILPKPSVNIGKAGGDCFGSILWIRNLVRKMQSECIFGHCLPSGTVLAARSLDLSGESGPCLLFWL
jgi:hypothetical protein